MTQLLLMYPVIFAYCKILQNKDRSGFILQLSTLTSLDYGVTEGCVKLWPDLPGAIEKIRCHKMWWSITDSPKHHHHGPQPCCKTVAFTLLKHSGPLTWSHGLRQQAHLPAQRVSCADTATLRPDPSFPLSPCLSHLKSLSSLETQYCFTPSVLQAWRESSVMAKAWNLYCKCECEENNVTTIQRVKQLPWK